MNCKNCECTVSGNFCSNCGQNSKVGKINFKNMIHEVSENIFQINRGFLYTFKEMFLNPEVCINEFLSGKRKKYFKPIAYLITLSTLYFLISKIAGEPTWLNDFLWGFSESAYDSKSGVEIPAIVNWFSTNFAYASLILLPVFSLASYFSFKGQGLNYIEHIVLNAYVTGQQAFIYSILIIFELIINNYYFEVFPLIISVSYAFYVFWKIHSKGNRIINLVRSGLTYVLYLLFNLIIVFALLFVQKYFT